MRFVETGIAGAYVIELDEIRDERGFFARAFCAEEFADHGLSPLVAQCNMSYNHKKGTFRGLHYQAEPAPEAKLIRCIQGAIYDVIVDMRPGSDSYLRHFEIELSADNRLALYVPEMCAHGYLALSDGAEVMYPTSAPYTPGCERGLRFDDPALNIDWPLAVTHVSDKDRSWPLLQTLGAH